MYININNINISISKIKTNDTVYKFNKNNIDEVIKTIYMYLGVFDSEKLLEIIKNSKLKAKEIKQICNYMGKRYEIYLLNLCL